MLDGEDIGRSYRRVADKLKGFLTGERSREFFIFLGFLLVAGVFWLLQTLNDEYETELTLPLRPRGVPAEVVITSDLPTALRVRVKDKGTVLLNYRLGKNFYPITMDFEPSADDGGRVSIPSVSLSKRVTEQLNSSTRLLDIKPDTLEYYYSAGTARLVPVRLSGDVSAGREYYLSDTIFTPDSVLVYAPRAAVDTITEAYTQPVHRTDISDTLRLTVPLQFGKGLKPVPSEVELMLPVDMYTEKTVEVTLVGTGFPTDLVLRTFPSKANVTFKVGISRLRNVDESSFHIYIPYEEVRNLGEEKFTLRLHNTPGDIKDVRISPEQVDFLIERINLTDSE